MTRLLSARLVRALISYDPETGEMIWRRRPVWMFNPTGSRNRNFTAKVWNTRYAGRVLGATNGDGYITVRIFGCRYQTHRIAWLIHTGKWPDDQLDHINGDPADNRISNLRSVTSAENKKNVRRLKNNKSGTTGVRWIANCRKWQASIGVKRKLIYLGRFQDKRDAIAARKAAERKYGFHENHGRS